MKKDKTVFMNIYNHFGYKRWHKIFLAVSSGILATVIIFSLLVLAGTENEEPETEIPAIAGEYALDRILIRFKPGTKEEKQKEIKNKNGLEEIGEIKQIETKVLKIKDRGSVASKIKALSKNKHVLYVEPDYVVKAVSVTPNDTYYASEQALMMERISAPGGWGLSTGSSDVVIAVLDSGVNMAHPDLQGRFVPGYDFVNNDSDPTDDYGHGTPVAGIAAATGNNGRGVAGIDWSAKIMPLKVLGASGTGYSSVIAKALIFAADQGVGVVNMSFGSGAATNTLANAVSYASARSVILVGSAGNESISQINYPAAYPEVISVSALQRDALTLASFSSYGSGLDVCAPGAMTYSTLMNGAYGYFSGTSAAAPFVSGLAALVRGVNPSLNSTQVREILTSTATDLGDSGYDVKYGYGRINMEGALLKAKNAASPSPADTTPPTVTITSPSSGASVAGLIDVNISAIDNVGISKVELLVDGKLYAQTAVSPYVFSLDTTTLTNGAHNLIAKAYDLAGNVGTLVGLSFIVNNVSTAPIDNILPTVAITSPQNGATVSKKTTISISASDNVGVARVEVYVNSKLHSTLFSPPYVVNWNVNNRNVPNGENRITAYAYDVAGNVATASIVVIK